MNKNDVIIIIFIHLLFYHRDDNRYDNFKKLILDIANQKYPELRKSMPQDDKHIIINNYHQYIY